MSKQELQHTAYQASGVSYEESLQVTRLIPCLYERLGHEWGCKKLSQLFYERVFNDKDNSWFLSLFVSSTKREAIDNQYRFLVQIFGGPALYKEKKGKYTRLAGRHANYPIGDNAANQWVKHMDRAIDEHPNLNNIDNNNNHNHNNNNNSNRDDGNDDDNDDYWDDNNNDDDNDNSRDRIDKNDNNESERMNEKDRNETKEALRSYFRYTAHYIVAASVYMRDDQLSGGTQIDTGSNW